MLRRLLRAAAGLVGIILIWPGFWAIISITNAYYPGAPPAPLFDRIAIWLLPLAIWAASISLMRFAFKKPR
jgi:hypothetical protein